MSNNKAVQSDSTFDKYYIKTFMKVGVTEKMANLKSNFY